MDDGALVSATRGKTANLADVLELGILRLCEMDAERGGPTLASSGLAHALGKLKSAALDVEHEHARWKRKR